MTDAASPPDGPIREDVRGLMEAKGHAVVNARAAVERLERAFASGELERTPTLDRSIADLRQALDQEADQKLGGKSAEAARFILRAIVRELDRT
jgi:hypothetical protein